MRKEKDSILFSSQKAIVLLIVPLGVFSRNVAFLHWLHQGRPAAPEALECLTKAFKLTVPADGMPSGPGPYRQERRVSVVRPDIKMKNDSPRRKKKRLNSLFEGMETTEQTRERTNTRRCISKGSSQGTAKHATSKCSFFCFLVPGRSVTGQLPPCPLKCCQLYCPFRFSLSALLSPCLQKVS